MQNAVQEISEEEVATALRIAGQDKATGSSGFLVRHLRVANITPLLTKLFNKILLTQPASTIWLKANMIFIL
jgi:hypothetical protein